MQFTLASVSLLLAGMASASSSSATFTPITSVPLPPSINTPVPSAVSSAIKAIPSASYSSIAAAESAAQASTINTDNYDCVYQIYGCDWKQSEYGYGSDYCGVSPFDAGQQLSDGHVVLAVSKDGSGDCASKAGNSCCKLMSESPCKRGERYLDCVKG
ncbi:hypothetical protein N7481_006853 [Penicillium waksmanii]|uniref:uncharacterized protein n=1 Tax=Penicillium waksmanii TaxID=69791 RepID=UPI0025466998|nr:uncharacterized protein N7481_006853 [Penicillium waksmanii]KAJ5979555.1 hypothetical protein N7481_006853 [Penicillium waksmanii]